jgi:hypothetical protein
MKPAGARWPVPTTRRDLIGQVVLFSILFGFFGLFPAIVSGHFDAMNALFLVLGVAAVAWAFWAYRRRPHSDVDGTQP